MRVKKTLQTLWAVFELFVLVVCCTSEDNLAGGGTAAVVEISASHRTVTASNGSTPCGMCHTLYFHRAKEAASHPGCGPDCGPSAVIPLPEVKNFNQAGLTLTRVAVSVQNHRNGNQDISSLFIIIIFFKSNR